MQNKRNGFTLIELIVSLACASILSIVTLEMYVLFFKTSKILQTSYNVVVEENLNNLQIIKKEVRDEHDPLFIQKRF